MNETQFRRKIRHQLEAVGALVLPMVAGKRQEPGRPDTIILHRLGLWLVEFKARDTAVTLVQDFWHRRANTMRPGTAWIVREDSPLPVVCQWVGYDSPWSSFDDVMGLLRKMSGVTTNDENV